MLCVIWYDNATLTFDRAKKSCETHTTLPFHPHFQLGVTENTHTNSMVVTWNLVLHILVSKKESFYLLGPNLHLEMGMVSTLHFMCTRGTVCTTVCFCLTQTPNIYLGHFIQTVCICKIQKSWTKKLGDLKWNECPFSRFKCNRFKFLSERSVIVITVLVVLYTYLLNLSQRKAK